MKSFFPLLLLVLLCDNAYGDAFLGVGVGMVTLPGNDTVLSPNAPDGETTPGSFYLYASSNVNDAFSLGASFSGYSLEKGTTANRSKWNIPHLNIFASYASLLGSDARKNPSLSLRAGGSFLPIGLETGTAYSGKFTPSHTYSEYKIAPYIGAELRVPLGGSRFSAFVLAEKTFAKYEDINIGALTMGAGIAYAFKRNPFIGNTSN